MQSLGDVHISTLPALAPIESVGHHSVPRRQAAGRHIGLHAAGDAWEAGRQIGDLAVRGQFPQVRHHRDVFFPQPGDGEEEEFLGHVGSWEVRGCSHDRGEKRKGEGGRRNQASGQLLRCPVLDSRLMHPYAGSLADFLDANVALLYIGGTSYSIHPRASQPGGSVWFVPMSEAGVRVPPNRRARFIHQIRFAEPSPRSWEVLLPLAV